MSSNQSRRLSPVLNMYMCVTGKKHLPTPLTIQYLLSALGPSSWRFNNDQDNNMMK